jgi:mannose-6-phosphate isomerase-like protein (cupin superfamily)
MGPAGDTLQLTPSESVTIVARSADELEVEASYGPGGDPPPKHLHPNQDEHFRVLEGSLRVRVNGEERDLGAGDEIEIPRGSAHQMWNPGTVPARVSWTTRPALRTEALQSAGKVDRTGNPAPLPIAVLLAEYRDVFRIAAPEPLTRPALALLAAIGRARGHRARRTERP